MLKDDALFPARQTLDRLQRAGRTATFWLRDDDAIDATEELRDFLDLTTRFSAPAMLAVIAGLATPALADLVGHHPSTSIAVHGWRHKNHAPRGHPPTEFGPDRPLREIFDDLSEARSHLGRLFGVPAPEIFVPPWNKISPALTDRLAELGYSAISQASPTLQRAPSALPRLDIHLDVVDWRRDAACRDTHRMGQQLARFIAASAETGLPVGILTHHAVHTAQTISFLYQLFEVIARHPAARWHSATELLQGMRAPERVFGAE